MKNYVTYLFANEIHEYANNNGFDCFGDSELINTKNAITIGA